MRELHAKYRYADPEKYYAKYHAWYATNRERILENLRMKRVVDGEQLRYLGRLSQNRRRGRLAKSEKHFTGEEWVALCAKHVGRCAYCGVIPKLLTIDHRVPLSRGGDNSIDNILPSCARCNTRKKDRDEVWFRAKIQSESTTAPG